MPKIKALILDAGGVMAHPVHGNWDIPARYRELLGSYASDIPGKAFEEACTAERHLLNEDCLLTDIATEYDLRLEFLQKISIRMGWQLSDVILKELAYDFTYNMERYVWYPDTDPTLTEIHQSYRIGVLSDAMPSFRIAVDQHDAPLHNFDAVSISTEVGAAKPNPAMYMDILTKLDLEGESCLFVDDKICNLEGAARNGIHTVQMCREIEPDGRFPFVRNMSELKKFLEALG